VDIVAGSAPAPATVALPAGAFVTPALLLTEDWVKEGVAVTILVRSTAAAWPCSC